MTQEQTNEARRLIELIAAAFRSDPNSIAAFDLNAIVYPTMRLAESLDDDEPITEVRR